MQPDSVAPFEVFLDTLDAATNETQVREAFVILAATGFGTSAAQFARTLALGAEFRVNFEKACLIRRGAIDSFYENLIIEFEASMRKTGKHAEDQLRDYVAGAWREDGNPGVPYLAVATDGREWRVFSPRPADPEAGLTADNVDLVLTDTLHVAGTAGAGPLKDFLNRLFFRASLLKPSARNFAADFGLGSRAFTAAQQQLHLKIDELENDVQLDVQRRAWSDSLQISYGSVETPNDLFVKHTYLAVLARLLVWAALERRPLSDTELKSVLSGSYFVGRGISNLVEDDYFKWYEIPSATDASSIWLALARHLIGYDLAAVREDILKPLYEQLVDPATRHDLGEYYTPDWLASMVVEEVLKEWTWPAMPRMVDPTSGSGTFVRACIDAVRARLDGKVPPAELLEGLTSSVMGFDIHPLAVVIGRATYMLAVQDLVAQSNVTVALPVWMANTFVLPPLTKQPDLFGEMTAVSLAVDDKVYDFPETFVLDGREYDRAIDDVVQMAKSVAATESEPGSVRSGVRKRLMRRTGKKETPDRLRIVETLEDLAEHLTKLIRERRDSIHGFILKNYYRPAIVRNSFDFVVGNPPWLTVGDIAVPSYKDRLVKFAAESQVASRRAGEQAHTELATLFLARVTKDYLSKTEDRDRRCRVGLVLPRSVFTASHHRNLREGVYATSGLQMNVERLWDLSEVQPLFNIPACVVFASPSPADSLTAKEGKAFVGRLPSRDVTLDVASKHVSGTDTRFVLDWLGERSAWRPQSSGAPLGKASKGGNAYSALFRQGAVLYPQTLLMAQFAGQARSSGPVHVRNNADAVATAKVLKDAALDRLVEAECVFQTAAADHILPYALRPPMWQVILPTVASPGDKNFRPVDRDELLSEGRSETAAWLDWAEGLWATVRKRGDETRLHQRLDHLGHLSAQAVQRRYIVIYIAAGNRPVATCFGREDLDRPFVARDGTYWASFDLEDEAMYMTGFLNSAWAAERILAWMNLGLFGPRHIHKRILDVPWPLFDPRNADHAALAAGVKSLTAMAVSARDGLGNAAVAQARPRVRAQLKQSDMQAVEGLVAAISSTV